MNIKKMKMNYNDLSFLRNDYYLDISMLSNDYDEMLEDLCTINTSAIREQEELWLEIRKRERIDRVKNLILRCLSTVTTSIKSVVKLITPKNEFEGAYKNENENEWWNVK